MTFLPTCRYFHISTKERYCSEKFKDPAPMGSGNMGVVNFAAETMLRSYKLFDEKNLYRLCGEDCLWFPNSIFADSRYADIEKSADMNIGTT